MERSIAMRTRIAKEINTTFASHYNREVSLRDVLTMEALHQYAKQATGEKSLIRQQL